jgi:NodT family efflux transporter outer membrane factor (OMF) lipoprotein
MVGRAPPTPRTTEERLMRIASFIFLLPTLALLAACEVGPDYERPPIEIPGSYKEGANWQPAQPRDDTDRGAWWLIYQDPVLNGLEDQVDISNQNLKTAEANYRQAVAVVSETQATLFPTVTLNASGIRSGTIGHQGPVNTYKVSTDASWAPDVWGRIRRGIETDVARAQASAADVASARLSAQGTLAADYFDLRAQDELIRLLNATVEDDKKAMQIVQNQYAAGTVAKADVLSAQTQYETVQSQAINAGVRRTQLEHAIAVLIGKSPAAVTIEPVKFVTVLPNVPAEAPSVLLERRPDIASAERAMEAANGQIGVATAAWYPNLTLTGTFGYTGTVISKLLQASNSLWSVGPALAETIFDAGAREAQVEQARASYDASVAFYRQTVLTAFQQVEDNLAALRILAEQAKAEDMAVADARKSVQLTLNQYKEGIVPYSSVLTAQTTALGNEQTALSVHQASFNASVALIQALGGGWDVSQLPKSF